MSLDYIHDSWYPLIKSSELKKACTSTLSLFGTELVLFRTNSNEIGVLGRHCPHMGGDLSRGRVSDAGLACPIHHWTFNTKGMHLVQDENKQIHSGVCQLSIRCVERWGLIFGFLGTNNYFDLPETQAPVYSSAPVVRDVNMHYTIPSLFGFDSEHFSTVHHRTLVDMQIYENARGHIGTALKTVVGTQRWSDRTLHKLGLAELMTDIDYWAGNIVLGRHRKTKTYALITSLPLDEYRSRIFIVTMQEKNHNSGFRTGLSWCRFQLARPLISAFIKQDEHALDGVRFDAAVSRQRADNPINTWLSHIATLPTTGINDVFPR